ncbi:MAG TPA: ATP-binding cassette domain-containing protein [Steroidobacteraceae bacterium]|nr:ATP-binding cassette domain-containing protein [Steroidobacteraceae bacterium]
MSQQSGPLVVDLAGVRYSAADHVIFDGLDLAVKRGSITAVMGPSGTGKTTVLRLLTGQIQADAGTVRVLDRDVATLNRRQLFGLRRRMGMLFQNGALLTDLDVFENVAFPVREHAHLPEPVLRRLVLMKLEAVGLRGAEKLRPQELSGGMARRVALARAIVLDPELLVYDEPFVGLDPVSMGMVVRLIKHLNEALGITSIVVSHDVPEVGSIADYSYLLAGGRAIAQGTTAELNASADPAVRQFMQGASEGPVSFHYPAGDYVGALLDGSDIPSGRPASRKAPHARRGAGS